MEDTAPAPLSRRSGDHRAPHRFLRFDPTVSSGALLQIGSFVIGFAVAYGTYTSDRTQMKADIEAVKTAGERDRNDVKATVQQFSADIKELKAGVNDANLKLVKIEAQNSAATTRSSR